MVLIAEWLPYPYDSKANQFIKLWNDSPAAVGLSGWRIEKANGKTFWLGRHAIPARGYLVLMRSETKLALKHSNESVFLYDAADRLVDHSSFLGGAKKGKSFARIDSGTGPEQHFAWVKPVPAAAANPAALAAAQGAAVGTANATVSATMSPNNYLLGVSINEHSLGAPSFFALAVVVGAILAALVVYFVKHEEEICELFFGGDETVR